MKYLESDHIIKEYRNALRKYANEGIVDMDAHLRNRFGFRIHRFKEFLAAWGGGVIPAYRQSHFLVALIKKGAGGKTIGHLSFPVKNNTLFVVPEKVPHSAKYTSLNSSGYLLSFDMAFLFNHFSVKRFVTGKRIFKKSIKPYMILTNEQAAELSAIFENLLGEYNQQLDNKDEMIEVKVLELLIQCERFFAGATPYIYADNHSEVIDSFHELIQAHYSTEKSVVFYANALHIHPNYLNFLMRKYTGLTAKQAIADHIFLEAKGLLSSSSLTLKEISYKLGFTAPSSFSSFFKKMANMSPSKYRGEI
jgi:AraC family transcriptional regulator, transcriptional activator of pobA